METSPLPFDVVEDDSLPPNVVIVGPVQAGRVLVGPVGAKPGDSTAGWRDLGDLSKINLAPPRGSLMPRSGSLHTDGSHLPAGPDYTAPPRSFLRLPPLSSFTIDLKLTPLARRLLFGATEQPRVPPGHYLG